MGLLDKIAFWRKKTTPKEAVAEQQASEKEVSEPEEQVVEQVLTEEEQQALQIRNFIQSDDISNHQLAAMFLQSLEVEWDEELYEVIGRSAEKMTFWAEQDLPAFKTHYKTLVINARFFSQYGEIADFAAILPSLTSLVELRWEAGPYWNQHPILVAASQLPQLKKLYVEGCKMHYLPEELCYTKSLEELYLKNNKLSELPRAIGELRKLHTLDLSHNQFKRCPRNISELKKLEVLYLQENPMADIEPRLLGRLYRLVDLRLPEDLAKFYHDTLKDWLPDVDFNKPYWQFD